MDDVIDLISVTYQRNAKGADIPQESSRQIFARISSVTRAEFFAAGRSGLRPELKFEIFREDYNGELILEYNGKRYGIYRTFTNDNADYIELYAEQKGGTNG